MRLLLLSILALTLAVSGFGQTPPVRFHDANREAGLPVPGEFISERKYIVDQMAGGVALFDCNNDAKLDLAYVNDSNVEQYRNGGIPMVTLYRQGPGMKFTNVTESAGFSDRGWAMGLAAADYDNDGLSDLYVTGYGRNVLYRNLGGCKFENVTAKAGVGASGFSVAGAWADYDRDGDLDLFVSGYIHSEIMKPFEITTNYKGLKVEAPWGMDGEPDFLFRNNGNGTFEDVSKKAGVDDPEKRLGLGVVWGDLDNDGWLDFYVANDTGPNYLYRNNQDGTFEDISLLSGVALSGEGKPLGSMGVDFGDFDRDGFFDIVVTNFAYQPTDLYRNTATQDFTDVAWVAKIGQPSYRWVKWGIVFGDFDNSGWLDMMQASGHIYTAIDSLPGEPGFREPIQYFRNKRNGTFDEIADAAGLNDTPVQARRGIAVGDVNDDGYLDAAIYNVGWPPTLFINDARNANHRVVFKLVGTTSNRSAIGSRITVTAGSSTQMLEVKGGNTYVSQSDLRQHFGLGSETRMSKVIIRWPNGKTEELKDVPADAIHTVVESQGIKDSTPLPPIESAAPAR